MRLAILCTSLISGALLAQSPQPGTPAAPAPEALDQQLVAHLLAWEATMKQVKNYAVEASNIKKNLLSKREEKATGTIWVMKPNLARYNMVRVPPGGEKPSAKDFSATICDGKAIYSYDGADKTVTVYKLGQNGVGQVLLLDLMSGMKAQDMVNRFHIKLLKQDDNYVYLEIRPRLKEDLADFESMTLALCGPKVKGLEYMPRLVDIRKQNGQEQEIWDFPVPKVNLDKMKEADFAYQPAPKDWRIQHAVASPSTQGTPSSNSKLPSPGGR